MKKKFHSKKNSIISNEKKVVWYLWPTVIWKTHDYKMYKDEFPLENKPFIDITLLVDLWYFWIVWDYWDNIAKIIIPEKKAKKSKNNLNPSLTQEQKNSNKAISSIRIKVEHTIWWIKRLWIISQIFRNKCEKFNDDIMQVASALWNLHILF